MRCFCPARDDGTFYHLFCPERTRVRGPRGMQEWSEIKEQAGTFSDIGVPAMRYRSFRAERLKAHVHLVPSENLYTLDCNAIG